MILRVLCRIAKLELFQINSQHEIALVGHGITTGPAWHSPAGPFLLGREPQTFVYWGSRPKPRRCAKLSRMSTLLSLRGRLMAGEVPRSKRGKVTGRGGLSILGLPPQTPGSTRSYRTGPTLLLLRDRLMPFLLGFHPKPRRCAKPSRRPHPAFAPRPPDGG